MVYEDSDARPEGLSPEQAAAQEARLLADGQALEVRQQDDYFGTDVVKRVILPDGISYVEHKVFSEGQRRKYLNATARDVRVEKVSGDAKMKIRPGDERYALLKEAIVGWNLLGSGSPVPFTDRNLERFLETASPRIVDKIELAVRQANPWLLANLTVEDIDQQIKELQEMRATKVAEEEQEAAFR